MTFKLWEVVLAGLAGFVLGAWVAWWWLCEEVEYWKAAAEQAE